MPSRDLARKASPKGDRPTEMANWISGAIKHPGALHRKLGVPQGKKIPQKKLAKAEKAGGTLTREARLAETLKHLRKRKRH